MQASEALTLSPKPETLNPSQACTSNNFNCSFCHSSSSGQSLGLGAFLAGLGGTLNGDPCSLLGIIGVLPSYIRGIQGLYTAYIRYED